MVSKPQVVKTSIKTWNLKIEKSYDLMGFEALRTPALSEAAFQVTRNSHS